MEIKTISILAHSLDLESVYHNLITQGHVKISFLILNDNDYIVYNYSWYISVYIQSMRGPSCIYGICIVSTFSYEANRKESVFMLWSCMKEENFIWKQKINIETFREHAKKRSSSRGIKFGSKRKFNLSEYKTIIYNN